MTDRKYTPAQEIASEYIRRTRHPAVFLDMRLGKTLVTIREIMRYDRVILYKRVLVLAPSSVLHAWKTELNEERIPWLILEGPKAKRAKTLLNIHNSARSMWCLANKETLLSLRHQLNRIPWDAVVLDESTFIKNPQAKITKAALKMFRAVPHRWILSGRPNPQSDLELWCQLAFLDGTAFGCRNYWQFREDYFCRFGPFNWIEPEKSRKKISDELHRRACVVSRKDVPGSGQKLYERIELDLPADARKIYNTVEEEFILEVGSEELDRTIWAIVRYTWLRRLCDGVVDFKTIHQQKLKALGDLITGNLRGESVVIWCNFNSEIKRVAAWLRQQHRLQCLTFFGDDDASEVMNRFQRGHGAILIAQPAKAAFGLDFSRADTCIYYSSPLSVEKRIQSEDRIVSPGKDALIIDLVIKNTVDVDILWTLKTRDMHSTRTLTDDLGDAMRRRLDDATPV